MLLELENNQSIQPPPLEALLHQPDELARLICLVSQIAGWINDEDRNARLERYTQNAVILAKSAYLDLITTFLPPELRQPVDLHPDLNENLDTIEELAGIAGQTADLHLKHQASVLLCCFVPACVIVELNSNLQEEQNTLQAFEADLARIFRWVTPYYFQFAINPQGEICLYRLTPNQPDDVTYDIYRKQRMAGISQSAVNSIPTIPLTAYGDQPNAPIFWEHGRVKTQSSRFLKALRGRPLNDQVGVRIITSSPDQEVMRKIRKRLTPKGWQLTPDQDQNPNPSSRIYIPKWWATQPGKTPIEIQVETFPEACSRWFEPLTNSPSGHWVDTHVYPPLGPNKDYPWYEPYYKAGQVTEVYNQLFPYDLYGINWSNPNVQTAIRNHLLSKILPS